ncbi:hypothetical protein A8W25_19480 [Streptomyces sp. ERV7]|nr:hypothetical protein A8W25_19480 [Streptomyces sp. ERV7]
MSAAASLREASSLAAGQESCGISPPRSPSSSCCQRTRSKVSSRPSLSCSRKSWAAARAAASAAVWASLRFIAAWPTAKYANARKSRPATAVM